MGADIITIFILEWELFYKESKFYHYANLEKKNSLFYLKRAGLWTCNLMKPDAFVSKKFTSNFVVCMSMSQKLRADTRPKLLGIYIFLNSLGCTLST
jgi:hypothetical protein